MLLFGALQGIRTPDLLVRSQTLYPAELAAHIFLFFYVILYTVKIIAKIDKCKRDVFTYGKKI